jgi:hypothetical protein
LDKHLNDLIKNAEGEKYHGTGFRKDMGRKFGVQMGRPHEVNNRNTEE